MACGDWCARAGVRSTMALADLREGKWMGMTLGRAKG
jgi:hypothetical protein